MSSVTARDALRQVLDQLSALEHERDTLRRQLDGRTDYRSVPERVTANHAEHKGSDHPFSFCWYCEHDHPEGWNHLLHNAATDATRMAREVMAEHEPLPDATETWDCLCPSCRDARAVIERWRDKRDDPA